MRLYIGDIFFDPVPPESDEELVLNTFADLFLQERSGSFLLDEGVPVVEFSQALHGWRSMIDSEGGLSSFEYVSMFEEDPGSIWMRKEVDNDLWAIGGKSLDVASRDVYPLNVVLAAVNDFADSLSARLEAMLNRRVSLKGGPS